MPHQKDKGVEMKTVNWTKDNAIVGCAGCGVFKNKFEMYGTTYKDDPTRFSPYFCPMCAAARMTPQATQGMKGEK